MLNFKENIIHSCKASDFKVLDGMIMYLPNRNLCLYDNSIIAYHDNIVKLVDKKFDIKVLNDRIFEFVGGSNALKMFMREIEISKAFKLASSYTQLAVKKVKKYVEQYYAISILKQDIIYGDTSLSFNTANCGLFFLGESQSLSYDENDELNLADDINEYTETLYDDIIRLQSLYKIDLTKFINIIKETINKELNLRIEKIKETKELTVSIKDIITKHNFKIFIKYYKKDCILLYPWGNSYDIFLMDGGYEWTYTGVPCMYFGGTVIKYHGIYAGPNLPGDIVIFDQSLVDKCIDLMDSLIDFSSYKKNWKDYYLPLYWLNESFYLTDKIKRHLIRFDQSEWEWYLTTESLDYLSDEYEYDVDHLSIKKTSAILYILISKAPNYKGLYSIVLHSSLSKRADYFIYFKKGNEKKVFCFITYFFNSYYPNKRQYFTNLSYSVLKSFGIEYWYKD